ncbi:serine hydrolase domain-containing protein [Nocardia sp. NPDC058114]|uniref:serine hydrolase domain-containing protein n=1 Tax=Nocardia sp. NPDC058114 TaxID=3346346 RepID=UPI0036D9B7C2
MDLRCRSRFRQVSITLLSISTLFAGFGMIGTPPASAETRICALPEGDAAVESVAPADVDIDQRAMDEAIAFASSRMRTNIQIFRNNCLVGTGPLNSATGNVAWHLWSSTKAVTALVVGVAVTQGLLRLDAPIGDYLPEGEGDAAHRAITIRDLLTQSSGLKQSLFAEAFTGLIPDLNTAQQALALPVEHPPGTFFEYSQRGPDLLVYVVQHAIGRDFQGFAQQYLFDPLGIDAEDYYWKRDRAGNIYGFAYLFLPPNDFSRIGLLLLNNGEWNGKRVIDAAYMDQYRQPSKSNACYGFLVWLNQTPCTGVTLPSRKTIDVAAFDPMPPDTYATVGFLHQTNFVVPSLNLLITWNGVLGDVSPDPSTLLSVNTNSELYREFLRLFARAITDVDLPDPGPYVPSMNLELDPIGVFDPNVLLASFGVGPYAPAGCTLLSCGGVPLTPPFDSPEPACQSGVFCLPVPGAPKREGQ